MSKFFKSILVLLGVLLLASCGGGEKEAKESESGKSNTGTGKAEVAIILKTLSNPFWVSMKEGIEKEAAVQGVKVDIFAVNSEEDVQEQLKLLENLMRKGYKAIGVAPLSPVNLIQGIVEANKKGIYVVNIDEKIDMNQLKASGGSVLAFVTTDNVKVGAKGAEYIVSKLPEGGEVAIIEGKAGNASGEYRKQGATEIFKADSKIKLVASQPADWDRSKALDLAANLIQKYPNLKAIYAANDTMALGALQAVINANKQNQIIVVGTDGAPEALESIKQKGLSATVAQDSSSIGAESFKILLEAIKNKPEISPDTVPKEVPVESKLVTE
ncbi:D-allose transporter substrate-binding protein [Leptotrichia sp. OH3620_COT-345]|uniref:D-allose transporter substrate-binding protein n=1 Tax=Leptotrichia sp. OH3620_COT-345 TaxID=2491048 RepID=UPI000F64574A|nr:D-allose transporter substrate-binding protein [Leptotrichia sp. OH3620_COT-345]RRD39201.1 D-allose transporter substrate-binding protein [Leptotrichia sp. OH3620_COT-345]